MTSNLTDTSKHTIKLSRGYSVNLTELIENLNHITVEIGWDQMVCIFLTLDCII